MNLRSKQAEETKKKILFAAMKEFSLKGFNGAKMRGIAAAAGVDKALVQYYFLNKQNIYFTIFQILIGDYFKCYIEKSIQIVDSWNVTPDIKLCAALYVLVNYELYVCDDDFHRLLIHEIADNSATINPIINEYLMLQLLSFELIIKDGIKEGYFEISDTIMFSVNILSFIRELAHDEYLKCTCMNKKIYSDNYEFLYNFIVEFSFKALTPNGKKTVIPILDLSKKNILKCLLKELKDKTAMF